jgi:hypothetical protein
MNRFARAFKVELLEDQSFARGDESVAAFG